MINTYIVFEFFNTYFVFEFFNTYEETERDGDMTTTAQEQEHQRPEDVFPDTNETGAWAQRLEQALRSQGFSDLSSGEDLSFALMNLISIEEHLACSFARTGDPFFVEALPDIRNLRRDLMKQVVREGYGEGWCISKHLLATAMRLLEVANKRQAEGQEEMSRRLIEEAFTLWSMFWAFTGKDGGVAPLPSRTREARSPLPQALPGSVGVGIGIRSDLPGTGNSRGGLSRLVKAFIDCCRDG